MPPAGKEGTRLPPLLSARALERGWTHRTGQAICFTKRPMYDSCWPIVFKLDTAL
jgi:hypothetical protein